MSNPAAYYDLYPRSGDVAVLCEGDVAGYDASILRKWIDRKCGATPLVDIWPCGTGDGLFGMSDAIGRSRPLFVIEDRDFRSDRDVDRHCQRMRRDRSRRNVQILGWQCWRRNEIENYFLDEPVLLPVVMEWFDCSGDEVREGVGRTIAALPVFQAAQYALYHARRAWKNKSDPDSHLRAELPHRPKWNGDDRDWRISDRELVRQKLEQNIAIWRERFVTDHSVQEPFSGEALLEQFDAKCNEWVAVSYGTPTWRTEWSGKEVLQGLVRYLAARRGWPNEAGNRIPIPWDTLNQKQSGELDREIEKAMQGDFVARLIDQLEQALEGDLYEEWTSITDALRDWKSNVGEPRADTV